MLMIFDFFNNYLNLLNIAKLGNEKLLCFVITNIWMFCKHFGKEARQEVVCPKCKTIYWSTFRNTNSLSFFVFI